MSIIISQVPLVFKNPLNRFALQDTLCSILYVCFAFLPFGKKIMEDILKELHLESLIPHFLAERIEPANVAALSDEELCRVGVTKIGDRLRLRDLCAVAEKDRTRESVASNVLQERMALFNGRNSRRADRKKTAVAKRSWTVSFVCVADRHQSKIPTSTEKQVLFQAGLGVKKIKLDLEDHGDEGDLQSLLRLHDKVLRPIMPPRSQARFVQLKNGE